VQLCKAAGAHVTGVCSTRNLDLVRAAGADEVIDRTVDDWSAMDRTWDVVLQVTGNVGYPRARRVLAADGRYVMAGVNADGRILGPMLPFLRLMARGRFDRRARIVRAVENADDLRALAELVEAGSLRPTIDRRFTLAEAADAMRYVEEGRTAGKIVVTV
jgi:NADPH:quinone reductase-like Zn-dependent oxidoreductase